MKRFAVVKDEPSTFPTETPDRWQLWFNRLEFSLQQGTAIEPFNEKLPPYASSSAFRVRCLNRWLDIASRISTLPSVNASVDWWKEALTLSGVLYPGLDPFPPATVLNNPTRGNLRFLTAWIALAPDSYASAKAWPYQKSTDVETPPSERWASVFSEKMWEAGLGPKFFQDGKDLGSTSFSCAERKELSETLKAWIDAGDMLSIRLAAWEKNSPPGFWRLLHQQNRRALSVLSPLTLPENPVPVFEDAVIYRKVGPLPSFFWAGDLEVVLRAGELTLFRVYKTGQPELFDRFWEEVQKDFQKRQGKEHLFPDACEMIEKWSSKIMEASIPRYIAIDPAKMKELLETRHTFSSMLKAQSLRLRMMRASVGDIVSVNKRARL